MRVVKETLLGPMYSKVACCFKAHRSSHCIAKLNTLFTIKWRAFARWVRVLCVLPSVVLCRCAVFFRIAVVSQCAVLFLSTFLNASPVFANSGLQDSDIESSDIESSDIATIDFVKGYATVFPNGDSTVAVFAKRGMTVNEKDLITTGENGFVSISFTSGIVVSIQPSSEVHAEQLDCALGASQCNVTLTATRGSINSNVDHSGNADIKFIINTPYASAAVRGTVFDIDVKDGRLLTGVTEGQISVIAESGQVDLPENFGTKVEKNRAPSPPKPLLHAPVLLPGPARYDDGAELMWHQVALASRYLVAFENSSGLVYRAQAVDPQHALQPLNVGSYAMSVRAIDQDGFLGRQAIREFDVVTTDSTRAGPALNATVKDTDFDLMVARQPRIDERVELQFSMNEEFTLLSSLDVMPEQGVSVAQANNSIYVRARGVLSNTEVTLFGPTFEIPGIE